LTEVLTKPLRGRVEGNYPAGKTWPYRTGFVQRLGETCLWLAFLSRAESARAASLLYKSAL
jgi:hypothetical protein